MKQTITKPKSRKELYLEQYEASKRGGSPFFPDVIWHDALMALIVVAAVFILAIILPAKSGAPANPTGTAFSPRPEWYFIFLQQYLRLFPGVLEPIGAILTPLIVVIILLSLPFFDRGLNRTFRKRKVIVTVGTLAIAGGLVLEITGILFPPTLAVPAAAPPPPGATFGQVAVLGKPVYADSCASCHGINGEGVVAPALWGPQANLKKYNNASALLNFVSTSMPAGAPGSLSHGAYLDIVGYLLVENNDVSSNATYEENRLTGIVLN